MQPQGGHAIRRTNEVSRGVGPSIVIRQSRRCHVGVLYLVQPQGGHDEEQLDGHGAEGQDAAQQARYHWVHVPGRCGEGGREKREGE